MSRGKWGECMCGAEDCRSCSPLSFAELRRLQRIEALGYDPDEVEPDEPEFDADAADAEADRRAIPAACR